ncbi:hypothetical protein RJ640_029902 [Escallonia rubra]|uniref:Trichome birefringence-like C-terminal domain-containing protein n=1 Tax=Escallonia rubra TaxID=112253 RepID=A0AA88QIG0_9ASTE|nr:hypothetical protein RJ640_029902 [Escallonia rubra]
MDDYFAANLNVADRGIPFSLRMSFQAALNHINQYEACKSIPSILRKSSPAHFNNGSRNAGGNCSRTSPQNESEVETGGDEIGRVDKKAKRFEGLDVKGAMLMRATKSGQKGEEVLMGTQRLTGATNGRRDTMTVFTVRVTNLASSAIQATKTVSYCR